MAEESFKQARQKASYNVTPKHATGIVCITFYFFLLLYGVICFLFIYCNSSSTCLFLSPNRPNCSQMLVSVLRNNNPGSYSNILEWSASASSCK